MTPKQMVKMLDGQLMDALTQLSSAEDAMDTAVATARAKALEDAAWVAENWYHEGKSDNEGCAAAIRAMIEQEDNG